MDDCGGPGPVEKKKPREMPLSELVTHLIDISIQHHVNCERLEGQPESTQLSEYMRYDKEIEPYIVELNRLERKYKWWLRERSERFAKDVRRGAFFR